MNDFLDYRENFLAHYGVLGMRWGVRKAERVERKAKRSFRKIDRFNTKIKNRKDRTGETGIISRAINARRRGRVAGITLKAKNRQAKAAYLRAKTSGNQQKKETTMDVLNKTRLARSKNFVQGILGISDFRRGNYNKHRAAGKGYVESVLTSGVIADRIFNSPTGDSAKRIAKITASNVKTKTLATAGDVKKKFEDRNKRG